jgi:hypothetical protein
VDSSWINEWRSFEGLALPDYSCMLGVVEGAQCKGFSTSFSSKRTTNQKDGGSTMLGAMEPST